MASEFQKIKTILKSLLINMIQLFICDVWSILSGITDSAEQRLAERDKFIGSDIDYNDFRKKLSAYFFKKINYLEITSYSKYDNI